MFSFFKQLKQEVKKAATKNPVHNNRKPVKQKPVKQKPITQKTIKQKPVKQKSVHYKQKLMDFFRRDNRPIPIKTQGKKRKAATQKPVKIVKTSVRAAPVRRIKDKQVLSDIETMKKYVDRKGRQKAKEFAQDMGLPVQNTRLVIPKTITVQGVTFRKYTSYPNDYDSAEEAARDMQSLGYKVVLKTLRKGSVPVFVLYRYKRGMKRSSFNR